MTATPEPVGASSEDGPLARSAPQQLEVRALRQLRASDVMSRRVVAIDGAASIAEAVRLMRAERVSTLITERRDPHDAWGIVTRPDVIRRVILPGLDPANVRVHEILTKPIVTVSPGLAVKFCLKLMEQARVRRVAVFDGHSLLGMLSHADIFAALEV